EAALRRLFLNERLLNRMWTIDRAESFERRDLSSRNRAGRGHARADRSAARQHGACAALAEAAAKLRPAETKIVAEDIQKRSRRIDINRVALAIDGESNRAHGIPPRGRLRPRDAAFTSSRQGRVFEYTIADHEHDLEARVHRG